jgi:hypothetical protein
MSDNTPALRSGGAVMAIVPQTLDDTYRLAKAVCMAGVAPKTLNTPEKAMVAIMHGMEVGFTPMMALQSIAVINGVPSIWGDGAIALVRSSPHCEGIQESLSDDGTVATCTAHRKGEPPITRTFSVDDAKKSKLWGKTGPWTDYPKRMLQMRARSFALRDAFPDVLRGLKVAEEVQDYRDITPQKNEGLKERLNAMPEVPKEGFSATNSEVIDMVTGEVMETDETETYTFDLEYLMEWATMVEESLTSFRTADEVVKMWEDRETKERMDALKIAALDRARALHTSVLTRQRELKK